MTETVECAQTVVQGGKELPAAVKFVAIGGGFVALTLLCILDCMKFIGVTVSQNMGTTADSS